MARSLCLSKDGHGVYDLPDDDVVSSLPFNPPDPDTSEDEDEGRFFAGLTRRLTQSKSFAGIPSQQLAAPPYLIEENYAGQSTLAGTTNCLTPMVVSPFPFPYETERLDLVIRAAAFELANLKMAPQEQQQHLRTLYSEKRATSFQLPPDQGRLPWTQNPNHGQFSLTVAPFTLQRRHAGEGKVINQCHEALLMGQQRSGPQKQIRFQIGGSGFAEGSRFGRNHLFPEPEWVSKVVPYGDVSLPKRRCAGTGVFLPRGYGNVALESRRKSGGLLLARRNNLLMRQRRLRPDGSLNRHEPCLLPQEWTY